MAEAHRVVIPYAPRGQFLPYHNRSERFACLVCHRRAGKTVAAINDLIRTALTCPRPNPRVAYIAPFYAQAKDVAWGYAKEFCNAIPGVQPNESELRLDFPNGGRLRLYGADNYDRMRGIYLDDAALDEPADFPPDAWPTVIRPALSDRKGRATFIGTPKGKNEFFDIWENAKLDDQWFSMMLKASESGLLDQEELDAALRDMGEDRYAQEFECSFEASLESAYYAKLINQVEAEGRVGDYPYLPALPVATAWDLGVDDYTAIWFIQNTGTQVRVIDYHEFSGIGAQDIVGHALPELRLELTSAARGLLDIGRERPFRYGPHFLPHDVSVREWGGGALERVVVLQELGLKDVRKGAKQGPEERISATRQLLPKCVFNATPRVAHGLRRLRGYSRKLNKATGEYLGPAKDGNDHGADAFGEYALNCDLVIPAPEPKKPPPNLRERLRIGPPEAKRRQRV